MTVKKRKVRQTVCEPVTGPNGFDPFKARLHFTCFTGRGQSRSSLIELLKLEFSRTIKRTQVLNTIVCRWKSNYPPDLHWFLFLHYLILVSTWAKFEAEDASRDKDLRHGRLVSHYRKPDIFNLFTDIHWLKRGIIYCTQKVCRLQYNTRCHLGK